MKALMGFEPAHNGKKMDSLVGRVAASSKLASTLPTEISIHVAIDSAKRKQEHN